MPTYLLAILAVVLSGSLALADPVGRPKPDYTTPVDRLPPVKSATAKRCAAYGPGFVQVEGTDSCMKVGGSTIVDVGGAARPH